MKKSTMTSACCPVKYIYGLILLLCFSLQGFSQSVSISVTGSPSNTNAGLDINFADKGFLITRVALTGTTSFAPLSAHIPGMMVYNTSTVGNVKPGLYYNDGTKWLATLPPPGNANGDLQYWDGTAWVTIPLGQPGQKLQLTSAGIPAWSNGGLATLATTAISLITSTTAISGGNITSDGGIAISARGVCWSTTPGPTTASSKTIDGSGSGSFTSSLTGLTTATTYYVRAYATNTNGTAYGNEQNFITP